MPGNQGIEIWEAISATYCYTTQVGGDRGQCTECAALSWYYARALCLHRDAYHYQARVILNAIGCVRLRSDMRSSIEAAIREASEGSGDGS